jgi:hypothetical protein
MESVLMERVMLALQIIVKTIACLITALGIYYILVWFDILALGLGLIIHFLFVYMMFFPVE